jgi:hypothetical protein
MLTYACLRYIAALSYCYFRVCSQGLQVLQVPAAGFRVLVLQTQNAPERLQLLFCAALSQAFNSDACKWLLEFFGLGEGGLELVKDDNPLVVQLVEAFDGARRLECVLQGRKVSYRNEKGMG